MKKLAKPTKFQLADIKRLSNDDLCAISGGDTLAEIAAAQSSGSGKRIYTR